MRKIGVHDTQGTRWTVRARRLRSTETGAPLSRPEQDSLRRRLTAALSPHPWVVADPLRRVQNAWWTPGDMADIELREARRANRDAMDGYGAGIFAVVGLVRLAIEAVEHLRTPLTDTWRLEAMARGRIRRWARWEVEGREAAERSAVAVAAAVSGGRVPEPDDAVLIEVVDQRPARSPHGSAGNVGARTPG